MRFALVFPFLVDLEVLGQPRSLLSVEARDVTAARAKAIADTLRPIKGNGPVVIVHGVTSPNPKLVA